VKVDLAPLLEALRACRPGGVGVGAWSVFVTEQRQISVGTRDGATASVHTPARLSESAGARYLVVWEDGKVSRGSLERRQLTHDAADAVRRARLSAYDDPDAARVLGPATFPEVVVHDARVARLVDGEIGVFARRLAAVRERVERGGFRIWSGTMSAAESRSRILSSRGLDVESPETSVGWHTSFEGEWGDGQSARTPDDETEFARRLDRLVETVRCLKRPVPPMAPGVHPVILHPHVVDKLVFGTLLHNLDGSTVAHGEGFFKRGEFGSGRALLREDLTLTLDPLLPLRSGSYRFTPEGVPAARCTYIRNGTLETPILDLKHASRLGMAATPVPFGRDTLLLEASTSLTEAEAYARAAGGALVLSVLGVHAQDPASGDFSLSAPQVLTLSEGGPAGRIRATLSGNVFAALRHEHLAAVRFEGETTPGLLFPGRLDPA
jgi:PmbA protein